ncbi:hypothetical protein NDU88_000633 [Pleurodeles waltl]|uniref:Uncharacterized protein n=1 Tax=Pleurodeles waltl TaxID=8319 RepID=A0AAV7MHE2_PLEWA|nr:hypothetical protein NDU88_000633 [Pleurodeles waltl]
MTGYNRFQILETLDSVQSDEVTQQLSAAEVLPNNTPLRLRIHVEPHTDLLCLPLKMTDAIDSGEIGSELVPGRVEETQEQGQESDRASSSIAGMLQSLSMEVISSFETYRVNQKGIKGLCEDLGKKLDDLANRTAVLEKAVGDLKSAVDVNEEEIRQLKKHKEGYLAKLESMENDQNRNNLRILNVLEGLEGVNLKAYVEELQAEAGKKVYNLKYLQACTWVQSVSNKMGSSNELEELLYQAAPMKKEVTRWYCLMMDLTDRDFSLP